MYMIKIVHHLCCTLSGLLLFVQSSDAVSLDLTASSEEWCDGTLAVFTCRALEINSVASLEWTAAGYFNDLYVVSTGHPVGTTRPKDVQPGLTFANLTYKDEMVIESKLHVFVKNSTYTNVTCTVNPPRTTRYITRLEGVYSVHAICYMYMYIRLLNNRFPGLSSKF